MKTRRLGKTNLQVSEIGFGGEWLERHPEEESIELIRYASSKGINIGLLDGRPEIQRYHWKRNQRKPQSVVHSGTYWFYMERQPVFPYQRYEICPSCIRRSVKKTADRLH